MATITVGQVRTENADRQFKVYVGRPSSLGNPYQIGLDGDRQECIAKYTLWLDDQLTDPMSPASRKLAQLLRLVKRNGSLVLLCWCHPEPCHADVIRARLLAALGEADDAATAGEEQAG